MKALALVLVAIGGGMGVWAIGIRLSTDAIGIIVGLLFGMLPMLLLVFVPDRRTASQPPPVVVVALPYTPAHPFALPTPQPAQTGEISVYDGGT